MIKKYFSSHNLYLFSLGVKALNGILEVIGSVLILIVDFSKLPSYISIIFREELIEDPNDTVANIFIDAMQKMDISIQFSGFLFLLSHGLVKLFLVIALLKKKYWAYPVSEIVLFLFIIYQSYLYTKNGSQFILILNFIDIILIVFIWIEYHHLRKFKNKDSDLYSLYNHGR